MNRKEEMELDRLVDCLDRYMTSDARGLCREAAAAITALRASAAPGPLDEWIEREFAGHGRALRTKYGQYGEPYMSMADAKELTRRAVAAFA